MMLQSLLNRLYTLYPRQEMQDIYKAVFQMCMGPEHILFDPAKAAAYLAEEYGQADPEFFPEEPLLLPLGRGIFRLNLRPAKRQGIALESIADAFLASSRTAQDRDLLRELVSLLQETDLSSFGIASSERKEFLARIPGELPPVHHSQLCRRLYRPSYRLVHSSAVLPFWLAD